MSPEVPTYIPSLLLKTIIDLAPIITVCSYSATGTGQPVHKTIAYRYAYHCRYLVGYLFYRVLMTYRYCTVPYRYS
jgi:hypothetical protein